MIWRLFLLSYGIYPKFGEGASYILADRGLVSDQEILRAKRNEDGYISSILRYLEQGTLPDNPEEAKKLVLESERYSVVDGLLLMDGCVWWFLGFMWISWKRAHSSCFSGHFSEK